MAKKKDSKDFKFKADDAVYSSDNVHVFIAVNPKKVKKLNKGLDEKDVLETSAALKRIVSRYEAVIKH